MMQDHSAINEDEQSDVSKPDKSLIGTGEERKELFDQISISMNLNQTIDPKTICSVPESKVTLDTPEGKTGYHRQHPIIR